MPASPRSPGWSLLLAFTAVAASFVGATFYTTYSSHNIDEASLSIAQSAMPSIQHLAAARTNLRELQVLFSTALGEVQSHQTVTQRPQIERTRSLLARETAAYRALPTYPGEKQMWEGLSEDLKQLDEAAERMLERITAGDNRTAQRLFDHDLRPASDRLSASLMSLIELNAENARALAERIERQRHRATWVAFALDGFAVILTVLAGLLALRAVRQSARFLEAHNRLLAARADELEQFAGRVAHDILSPLGAAALVFGVFERKLEDPKLREFNARGISSVQRVQRIVDGLLEFARAGARPDPRARAEVRDVTLDVAAELRPVASDAMIELLVDPPPTCAVNASPGVLTSMVANLVRNAIKYMDDSPVRRIEVRIEERGDRIHFEVSDTGPGLPPELGDHVFEPYVRGRDSKQPGIGLGLATVRRMAEAHGGRIGVDSRPGKGSCFWFELPRATREVEVPATPTRHAPN
jgi:signal transduction histidine kinase